MIKTLFKYKEYALVKDVLFNRIYLYKGNSVVFSFRVLF